jgi:hypothetical protein
LAFGTANPTAEEISRLGSLVSFRAITQKVICPGLINFNPFVLGKISHPGGNILDT